MDIYGSRPENIYGRAVVNVYGSHPDNIYGETMLNVDGTPGGFYGSSMVTYGSNPHVNSHVSAEESVTAESPYGFRGNPRIA